NMAFTFIIRMFWQFHAVTALCFVPACHNEKSTRSRRKIAFWCQLQLNRRDPSAKGSPTS
ncbi:MAG: hypothetical protein LBC02_14335, partial [Planctomycetaceae bacterium]|nr:hypothetical protein [Planctomycetaceae bacterium]